VKAAVVVLLIAGAAHAHLPGISRSTWERSGRDVEARFVFSRADVPEQVGPRVGGCPVVEEDRREVDGDGVEVRVALRCASAAAVQVKLDALLVPLGRSHRHFARHDEVNEVMHAEVATLTLAAARSEVSWWGVAASTVLLVAVAIRLVRRRPRGPV
jgi:hypothetical protein